MNSIPTDLPAVMETARGPGARAQASEPEAFAGVLQTAQQQDAGNGQCARPAITRSDKWAGGKSDEGIRDASAGITTRPAANGTEGCSARLTAEDSPTTSENSKRDEPETNAQANAATAPLVAEMAALQALLQSQSLTQSPTPALPTGLGAGGDTTTSVPVQAGIADMPGGLPAALSGQGTGAITPGSPQAFGTAGVNLASQATVAGAQPDAAAGRVSADGASPQTTGLEPAASAARSPIPGQGVSDELAAQAAVLANGSVPQANAQPAGEHDAGQGESASPNAEAQPPVLMAATALTSAGPDTISSGSQPTAAKVATVEASGPGAERGSSAGPNAHPGIAGRVPANGATPSPERPVQAAGDATRADPVVTAGMRAADNTPNEPPAQGGSDQNAEPSVGGVAEVLLSAFDGQIEAGSSTARRSSSAAGTGDGHGQGVNVSQSGSAAGTGGGSHLFTVANSASPQGSLAGQTGSGGGETPGRQTGNLTAAGAAGGAAMATIDNGIPSAVGQAIMARLVQAVKSGERQFHLELYPAELGRVQAQLSINAGKLSLVLDVETVQAQQAVHNALPELRQGLEARGLVLDQCQVGYSDSGQTHGGGHYNSHAHQTPAIPFGRLDRVPSVEKAIATTYRVRSGRSVDLMV